MLKIAPLAFLLLFGCHGKKPPAITSSSVPVEVAYVEKRDVPIFIETIGHVDSINAVAIKSRIEGLLTEVHFQEGQEVKKGDLLFTIDPREKEANLKKTEAVLEENLASLRLAEDKVLRYATLVQDEYYSEVDYETLQTNALTLEATIAQNRAEIEQAKVQLSYCSIYAPIDGKTGVLQIDEGNMIKPNSDTPIITINQMDPIYVNYSVPEKYLPEILEWKEKVPPKILVAFHDFTQSSFEGTLDLIDNSVDTSTGMIELRGIYSNEERKLWPGQFVRVRHVLHIQKEALLIPYEAVVITTKGPFVYVVGTDHKVSLKKVELGQREDEKIIVLKGVKAEEVVVTEGQINLVEGSEVEIKKRT